MTTPTRILILYAHAAPQRSRINRRMAQAAAALPDVQVRDLYEIYPDFDIDVRQEQALLAAADLVVFQHPIQWYGMPALLKEWVDVVLEEGWAYGSGGDALRGKDFWLAASFCGAHGSCRESDRHHQPSTVFLPPFRQTAHLCGMNWLPPHILHGEQPGDETTLAAHVDAYVKRLRSYPRWVEAGA